MGRTRNPSSNFHIFFGTTDMRVAHMDVYPEPFPVEAIINIIQFHLPSYLEDAESKFL
jgi:hypothetical protein